MDRSVKDKVIALAQADPFLTVEELGRLAGTTGRYVRTLLSEAGLSLNRLRRRYARDLEYRLGRKAPRPAGVFQAELRIVNINGSEVDSPLAEWGPKQELFQVSALKRWGEILSYVQLITPEIGQVRPQCRSLRELLPAGPGSLKVGEQRVEIVAAPAGLGPLLSLEGAGRLLKLSSALHRGGSPAALELRWLNPDGLVLQWSEKAGEIKVLLTG